MPALACGCWVGLWNRVPPPARCAVHAATSAMVIIDPTVNLSDTDGIMQRVRAALTQHPPDNGAAYHTMDRGTADVISRMLIDGAPAPAWVWDCLDPNDGCDNRICRLAHLMKQAQAAKAAPPASPARPARHICNADDCCTAEERDRAFERDRALR